MSGFAVSSQAQYRDRFPRDQREAGLEFKPWDKRSAPIRSISRILIDLFELAGICLMVAGFFVLCWMAA